MKSKLYFLLSSRLHFEGGYLVPFLIFLLIPGYGFSRDDLDVSLQFQLVNAKDPTPIPFVHVGFLHAVR